MRKSMKKQALEHYDRMIAWAAKENPRKHVTNAQMSEAIGECWRGPDCSYCKRYYTHEWDVCSNIDTGAYCPLGSPTYCCDHLWQEMNWAKTWGTWVKRARRVRKYIEEHG